MGNIMKDPINITEQDIFNFIFHPELLIKEKKDYLDSHQTDFSDQIEFCKYLKKHSVDKSMNASNQINLSRSIELYPIPVILKNQDITFTLAAASSELDKKIETKTFTDPQSQFLVRMVSTDQEKTLYVFAKDKNFKQAKLTILPSQKTFNISPLESSIKIDKSEEIEKISIEKFN